MSIWIELACLLANIFLESSISVCPKCFPTSVANLSEGITWCLPGSTQCLSCLRLSDGFDQCLSELVLTCFFLPMSVRRNLLMSVWIELTCLLASVCLKWVQSVSARSVSHCLSVGVFLVGPLDFYLSSNLLSNILNSSAWKDLEFSTNLYLCLSARICLS